jgi:hypothetical protein
MPRRLFLPCADGENLSTSKEFIMNKHIATLTTLGAALFLTACASTDAQKRVVLPLDHGPRAQTTPWENKQRLLRAEQQAKARPEKSSPDSVR